MFLFVDGARTSQNFENSEAATCKFRSAPTTSKCNLTRPTPTSRSGCSTTNSCSSSWPSSSASSCSTASSAFSYALPAAPISYLPGLPTNGPSSRTSCVSWVPSPWYVCSRDAILVFLFHESLPANHIIFISIFVFIFVFVFVFVFVFIFIFVFLFVSTFS